jgi:hypothetical protein
MTLQWTKIEYNAEETILSPAADFRINVVSRLIAKELRVAEDAIWWSVLIDPATRPGGGNAYTISQIYELAKEFGLGDDPSAFLNIPPEYSEAFRTETPPGPVEFYARKEYINAVNKTGERVGETGINWLEVGPAYREHDLVLQSEPFSPATNDKIGVPEGSVVMAIIDNGMAVGHELFRASDGSGDPVSRVEFYWNMDGSGVDTAASQAKKWTEPTSSGNGWTKLGLSKRLKQNMHAGLLDDPAFYASIGATDWATRAHTPVARRLSHGTHVMGLCAGYSTDKAPAKQLASKRPIIAVNLRAQEVEDPSGMMLLFSLPKALDYILERYKRFEIQGQPGKRPPLVINFSFGNFAGPHDGTSLIERYIEAALKIAKPLNSNCQFVLPAGNGNQSRSHAKIKLTDAEPGKTLNWRVQPGDKSSSAVQIWLDDEFVRPDATLTIQGPGGLNPLTLNAKTLFDGGELKDSAGQKVGFAYYLSSSIPIFKRSFFHVILYATSHPLDVGPFAPSGLWELTLEAKADAGDVGMHAWIERDETLPGYSEFGRQSYFDDPHYARFYEPGVDAYKLDRRLIGGPLGYDPLNSTALVRRKGTLNGFAGGDSAIVVGGYVQAPEFKDSPMALYSSTGLMRKGVKAYPDAAARSDDSKVMQGVLSAGSASGSFVAMNGTSVSAPQVARLVASVLMDGNPADPGDVEFIADEQDPTIPIIANPRKPPEMRTGGGRLPEFRYLFGHTR